jgi:hypothetical protein
MRVHIVLGEAEHGVALYGTYGSRKTAVECAVSLARRDGWVIGEVPAFGCSAMGSKLLSVRGENTGIHVWTTPVVRNS